MKRILLIATEFAPGMIPYASSIINTLSNSEKFEVFAIVVNSPNRSFSKSVIVNRKIRHIEYPKTKILKLIYKFYPIRIIREIKRITKSQKIDAVHLLTGDFSLFTYLLFNPQKEKFYYTIHDLYPHESKDKGFCSYIFHKYLYWCTKNIREIIPHLTTSSKSQYAVLCEKYPNKQIFFTHFPTLVTEEIKKGTMAVAELKNTSDYILFFGTVDHYKGVDILISAYNRHPESDKHKLVIAGLGNLDKITEPNIIRLNRFIKDAEVRDLFTKAAIVVYPYRSATMSGVLSLAFYFRKKVVMSDVPFFKEYANRDSLFFKAGNVEDLADKLQQALDSGSASTNANLYPEFYSENILEQDYINLYSSPANKQM